MVLVPLLTLNIGESIMRFALDKDADCDKIMSTGITILIFGAIIGLLILPIANLFESVSNYSIYEKKKKSKLKDSYGMVIVDECHHGASTVFESVLNKINSK